MRFRSGSDLVIGSRYTPGGGLGDWHAFRKLLSAAAVWATWPIQRVGLRAKDPMSGFFFIRRNCLEGIAFQQSGFKLLLEILVRAQLSSVREIPFAFGQRYRGASKANMKVAVEYGRLLARLYRSRFGFEPRRPGQHFRMSGFFSGLSTAPASAQRIARNPTTPRKNTSAMRMPGSRLTSGTRSLAPT